MDLGPDQYARLTAVDRLIKLLICRAPAAEPRTACGTEMRHNFPMGEQAHGEYCVSTTEAVTPSCPDFHLDRPPRVGSPGS